MVCLCPWLSSACSSAQSCSDGGESKTESAQARLLGRNVIKLELLGVGGVRVLGYKYIHTARVCMLCQSSVVVQAFSSRPGCLTQKQVQYEGVKGGRCDGDGDAHQPRAVTARRGLCVGVTQLECHCCLRRERPASLVLQFSVVCRVDLCHLAILLAAMSPHHHD